MSIINVYGDSTLTVWELDDNGQKISIPIQNETKQVTGNKVVLEGLPDEQHRVFIDGFVEIDIKDKITETNQFKVAYRNGTGIIFVHPDLDGQWITVSSYASRGQYYISARRIWTKLGSAGEVLETLDQALEAIGEIAGDIEAIANIASEAITVKNDLLQAITNAENINSTLYTGISNADAKITDLNNATSNSDNIINNINTSIGNANIAKSNLDNVIANAILVKGELNTVVGSASILNDSLESLINTGTTLNNSLSSNIQSGNVLLGQLENMIVDANTAKSNLDGSISTANTTKIGLDNSISQGDILKGELDDIIAGADFEQVITDVSDLKVNKVDNSRVLTDVPINAKFTDTIYTHPTSDGNLHVPATGTTNNGKVLKAGATAGSLVWGTDYDTITTINGKTGAITKADIVALGIPAQDSNTTYTAGAGLILTGTVFTPDFGTGVGKIVQGNDGRLSDARVPLAHDHNTLYNTKTEIATLLDGKVDNNRVLTDVPLGAKFTDTVYTHPTTAGNKHIPTGGANGNFLKYSASGTAVWVTPTNADVGLPNVTNDKQMPISNGVLENYREKLVTLSGTSTAIDLSLGNVFTHTLSDNTTYSITNAQAQAHPFTLIITQGSAIRTITFPASVKWAGKEIPDLSEANTEYTLTFLTKNGGTNWIGFFGGGA